MYLKPTLTNKVRWALEEDRFQDDVTSRCVLAEPQKKVKARIVSRENGVFSGEAVCKALETLAPAEFQIHHLIREGSSLETDQALVDFEGPAAWILGVERVWLNFWAISCGVATQTAQYVHAVKAFPTKILATRKTLPGLRDLQLEAVRAGGGMVHRRSLSDGILIKDNHLILTCEKEAVRRAHQERSPLHRVEIEVESLEQLDSVLTEQPDIILLDNMTLPQLREAVQLIGNRCQVEVSGGVDLKDVRAIAEVGVDYISVGRITHSMPAFNLSLELLGTCPEN